MIINDGMDDTEIVDDLLDVSFKDEVIQVADDPNKTNQTPEQTQSSSKTTTVSVFCGAKNVDSKKADSKNEKMADMEAWQKKQKEIQSHNEASKTGITKRIQVGTHKTSTEHGTHKEGKTLSEQ